MKKFTKIIAAGIVFLLVFTYGCGEEKGNGTSTSSSNGGTRFTGYVPGKKSEGKSGETELPEAPEENGISFTVRDSNVTIPPEQISIVEQQAFIYIGGNVEVDNVTYSISFTFIKSVSYPHTYNLVTGRPQSQDDAVFFYQEAVSGGTVKTIQKVKDGLLVVKKLSDREITGGFWARIGLDNGEDLYIHDGTINLER